jgi:SET domain-containing protein
MIQKTRPYKIKRSVTGLGLFAVEPIPKGKRIVEYLGPLISNEVVERSNGKYFFGVNSKWSIDGSLRSNAARYINHSCRPNADAFVSGRRVWIWSRRNIRAGEEITYDYGEEYFEGIIEPMGCKCAKCRETETRPSGRVRKRDSSPPPQARKSKPISLSESNLRATEHATAVVPACSR